ncbi:cell division protein FtsX [Altererythrobacter sp. CC-YST694]|uniref:cell division protein FtsX n=1 Tax=Altererythrobacter sp. CC-YST694 TaxID=2755038 RepID=UPI001D004247|nr:cell division protein [Altererythrobacter sp. CC-YST694]
MSWLRMERKAQLVPQARLAGPMPWVIAIMVALTTIAAAGGLALNNLAQAARAELSGGLTVQIVEAEPAERERQAELALSLLANVTGVETAQRVADSELRELVEPWLGEDIGTAQDVVPVPALIDVRLSGPVTPEKLRDIRALLKARVPAAQVDAQSSWLAPVFSAISSLKWLAAGLVILLGATSAAAVWLAARSALGTNRATIEIVHLLGGSDGQIARIFQRSVGIDALLGGVAGALLGAGAVLLLGRQFAALGSGMVAGGGLGWADWLAIAGIPFAGVLIAMFTARLTVLAALRKML